MKRRLFIFCILFFSISIFAQEEQEIFIENEIDFSTEESFDDFSSLFDSVEDITVENQEPVTTAEMVVENTNILNNFVKPLNFSGNLSASVGLAALYKDKLDFSGYFSFENDLFFSARGSKNLAIKGTIHTEFPTFSLALSEIYFDYLLLDRVYIVGGKKSYTLGYPQLFSDLDIFNFSVSGLTSNVSGYSNTNILVDSSSAITVSMQMPFSKINLSGYALYPLGAITTSPSIHDISFVAAIEGTLFNFSTNLFLRKNPKTQESVILGLETKRTIFSVDFYVQGIMDIASFTSFTAKEDYNSIVATGGLYKWWELKKPLIGFNIEYQYKYTPNSEQIHNHYLLAVAGISRLGKRKNIKLGINIEHDIMNMKGMASTGIILSNILPHADWKTGFSTNYNFSQDGNGFQEFVLGTSLSLYLNY